MPKPAWKTSPVVLPTALFLVCFCFYNATLNPSLFRDDSPETVTAGFLLGVAHPPGYPLHTLLNRLFSLIPVGNPAYRINLGAAFLASLACLMAAFNLRTLLDRLFPREQEDRELRIQAISWLGAGLLALSPAFWGAALSAKGGVYVFHTLLILGLLLCLQFLFIVHQDSRETSLDKRSWLVLFVLSLALDHHWQSLSLFLVAGLAWAFLNLQTSATLLKKTTIAGRLVGFSLFLVGISLYLYAPLRAALHPAVDFMPSDHGSGFWDYVSRSGYRRIESNLFSSQRMGWIGLFSFSWEKSGYVLDRTLRQVGWYLPLALAGLFFRDKVLSKGIPFLLFLNVIACLGVNLLYMKLSPAEYWHLDDYLLTLNWTLPLLCGWGLAVLVRRMDREGSRIPRRAWTGALWGLALLAFPVQFARNEQTDVQKGNFLYDRYGQCLLKSLDRDAVYFTESDFDLFSTLYLTKVEGKRPDVGLFPTPLLNRAFDPRARSDPDYPFQRISTAVHSCLGTRPVYFTFSNGIFWDWYLSREAMGFRPEGLVLRLNPPKAGNDRSQTKFLDDFWSQALGSREERSRPENAELLQACAHPFFNTALYLRAKGDLSLWDRLYERGLSLIHDDRWLAQAWEMKGDVDLQQGKVPEARDAFEKAHAYYLMTGDRLHAVTVRQKK